MLDTIPTMRILIDFWTGDGAGLCIPVMSDIRVTGIAEDDTIQGALHPLIGMIALFLARLVRDHMMGFFPLLVKRLPAICAQFHLA
jgi:hypothetical protein